MIRIADTQFGIESVLESIVNGQYKQAKDMITEGCKTKPEKMAQRLGHIIACISDEDIQGCFGVNTDHAIRLINQFNMFGKYG